MYWHEDAFFTKLHTSYSLNYLFASRGTSQATLDSIHHVSTLYWWGTRRAHTILDFDAKFVIVKMFRMQKFELINVTISTSKWLRFRQSNKSLHFTKRSIQNPTLLVVGALKYLGRQGICPPTQGDCLLDKAIVA